MGNSTVHWAAVLRRFMMAVCALSLACISRPGHCQTQMAIDQAIERGIRYLETEIPQWIQEHRCVSCHHQGVGARTLLLAHQQGRLKNIESLQSSFDEIAQLDNWNSGRAESEGRDLQLARIQFAATSLAARGVNPQRFDKLIQRVAPLLRGIQADDGSIRADNVGIFPSPITLGPILTTGMGLRVLQQTHDPAFADAIARAKQWIIAQKPRNTLEAASLLITVHRCELTSAQVQQPCIEKILAGQDSEGGWGPHANAPPENYDTALALIALATVATTPQVQEARNKGLQFLLAGQESNGAWPETVRAANTLSYAHRVATTAWVIEALCQER